MGAMSVDARFSKSGKGVLAFLAVINFALAVLAFQASNSFQESLESNFFQQFITQTQASKSSTKLKKRKAYFNPFIDSNVNQKQWLLPQYYDLDEQYRSMHFDKERQLLRNQLLVILKQLVNVSPFDTRYWLHLFHTSSRNDSKGEEFAWIVDRAYRLLKWNRKETTLIARYCVREYSRLNGVVANSCAEIITDMVSNNNAKQLSRLLRADYSELSFVSKKIGLNFEPDKP